MTYAPEVATCESFGDALTRNTVLGLILTIKVTQNIDKYPLHYVTYAAAKFEIATFNSLGGGTFIRDTVFDLLNLTLGSM